jgi:hypothetical protein
MIGCVYTTHPKPLGMTQSSENGTTVYQNGSDLRACEVDLEDSTLEDDKELGFTSLYDPGLLDIIAKIVGNKLQHRDLTVLIIHVIHSDWRTGRCRLTTQKVAEILGYQVKTLYPSIRRLKDQNLLVPIKDSRTGEKLYIISPFLLKVGSGKARGFLLKTYYDAINKNQPDTSHPAGDDLEDSSYYDEL